MTISPAVLSSKDMGWQTPDDVLELVRRVAPIELDVCTVADNPVGAMRFYTPAEDGLSQSWELRTEGVAWMNPPYGRALPAWIDKAIEEASKGVHLIALVPARTDTKWFDRMFATASSVCLWRGRMKFKGARDAAPFPSALICWSRTYERAFREVFASRGLVVRCEK